MTGPNDKGVSVRSANPPKTYSNTQPEFASGDDNSKALRTMQAHAALAGCTLHELASGGFLLCRWGLAKELPDLRAVAALLSRMGVRV